MNEASGDTGGVRDRSGEARLSSEVGNLVINLVGQGLSLQRVHVRWSAFPVLVGSLTAVWVGFEVSPITYLLPLAETFSSPGRPCMMRG